MFLMNAKHEFTLQVAAAMCFGLAVSSLLFAFAYSQDISAIIASPAQLWAFVCGVPLQRSMTIPIFVGLAICATSAGMVLLYLRYRVLSRHSTLPYGV